MNQFIPSSEGKFTAWANNFAATVEASPETYGLSSEDITALKDRTSQWDSNYADAVAKRDAAQAATVAKQLSRQELEEMIRDLSRQIQVNPTVSEQSRKDAGLPVHKTTRTPVAVPTTVPVVRIEKSEALAHIIGFVDSATPTRRGRPAGIAGCQVYVAVGDRVPDSPKEYRFFGQSTKSPVRVTFESEDGCKMAHYLLRWVNTRGEAGPWSTVISGTIAKV